MFQSALRLSPCLGLGTASEQIAGNKWRGFFGAFISVRFNHGLAELLRPEAIDQPL